MTPAERIATLCALVERHGKTTLTFESTPEVGAILGSMIKPFPVLVDVASAALTFLNARDPHDLGTAHAALAAAVEKLGDQR